MTTKDKHFLQKIYDEAIESQDWAFARWFPTYQNYVQEYIEQATNNSWSDAVLQRLVKDTTDNGISDLQQGNFTWDEFKNIKNNWSEIQPTIKSIAVKNSINRKEYEEVASFLKKQALGNRPAGTNRVIAAFLPNVVTTVVNYKYLKRVVIELKKRLPQYPEIQGDWLEDNINFIGYCNSNIEFIHPWHSSLFGWYLKNILIEEQS